jgi:hypothetical protein
MQKVIAADANLPANPTPPARGFTRLPQINPPIFHKRIHTERERERERDRETDRERHSESRGWWAKLTSLPRA